MTRRAIYDAMVFYQWAALPSGRQHGTVAALYDGSIRLCISRALFDEVRDLLSRPVIRAKVPELTDARVAEVLEAAVRFADWYEAVPPVFTLPQHPDDDHLFNLAIESGADYLVTWESRILSLADAHTPKADELRRLAPNLKIVRPDKLRQLIRAEGTT